MAVIDSGSVVVPSRRSDPKYIQIKDRILKQILDGELEPGRAIPSISQLMEEFQVSKVTAVRAVAELEAEGYVKRQHGRGTFVLSLRHHNHRTRLRRGVSVVFPDMANPFYSEVVAAIEKTLRPMEYTVEIACTGNNTEEERELLQRVASENHLAGAIVIPVPIERPAFALDTGGLPFVVVDHCPSDLRRQCSTVGGDNRHGAQLVALHLLQLGHSRIGFVRRPFGFQNRLKALAEVLAEHGVKLGDNRVFMHDFGRVSNHEMIDWVRNEGITALAVQNDVLAMEIMPILRSGGLRIPQDISMVGYDDIMPAHCLEVPLTTVRQHQNLIGRYAAEALLAARDAQDHQFRPRDVVVVPELVVRVSTAPPAA